MSAPEATGQEHRATLRRMHDRLSSEIGIGLRTEYLIQTRAALCWALEMLEANPDTIVAGTNFGEEWWLRAVRAQAEKRLAESAAGDPYTTKRRLVVELIAKLEADLAKVNRKAWAD